MVTPENPKNQKLSANANQEVRGRDNTPAHTINVQSVTDNISRRVTKWPVVDKTSLNIVDHRVKVIDGCYRNVMLLQQLLPAMC